MKTTETKIDIYENDGIESKGLGKDQVIVRNHWNRKEFVCVEINGKEVTVLADELNKAIQNAQNIHKY